MSQSRHRQPPETGGYPLRRVQQALGLEGTHLLGWYSKQKLEKPKLGRVRQPMTGLRDIAWCAILTCRLGGGNKRQLPLSSLEAHLLRLMAIFPMESNLRVYRTLARLCRWKMVCQMDMDIQP
jgi:hypothetical protein